MDHCRIGLIGAGGVATRHARVLSGFPDVRVVAVADPVPGRAEELARHCDCTPYENAHAMLDRERLDAAYICVPPFAHGEPERAAIAAGLPFFVEKPLALDLPTAQQIAAEVQAAGLVTAVGHHWRYLDVLDQARELMAGREVHLALGHWLDKVPPVGWWVHRDGSGGQVVEQAVHVLDLARVLVGEIIEVHTAVSGTPPATVPPARQGAGTDPLTLVDAATAATLRFATGTVGTLATTCLLGWKHRAGLQLYADGLALEITESELTVDTGAGPQVTPDAGTARARVDRAFVDAVCGLGDDIRAGYPEALRTHAVACAVARSARVGVPVRLAETTPQVQEPVR